MSADTRALVHRMVGTFRAPHLDDCLVHHDDDVATHSHPSQVQATLHTAPARKPSLARHHA